MRTLLVAFLFLVPSLSMQAQGHEESNYDETKVPQYTLPDPLKTQAGKNINSVNKWEKIRKSEILRLFENNVYGQLPDDYDSIKFRVIREDLKSMDGKAHHLSRTGLRRIIPSSMIRKIYCLLISIC